jgi:prepilin-type N-terminal cleavage/methylation domain-containing protein
MDRPTRQFDAAHRVRGLTLVELVVVVVIVGVLASVVTMVFQWQIWESKWAEGKSAAHTVHNQLMIYRARFSNRFPGIPEGPLSDESLDKIGLQRRELNSRYFGASDFKIESVDADAGYFVLLLDGDNSVVNEAPEGQLRIHSDRTIEDPLYFNP